MPVNVFAGTAFAILLRAREMDVCMRPRWSSAMNNRDIGVCGVTRIAKAMSDPRLWRCTGRMILSIFYLNHVSSPLLAIIGAKVAKDVVALGRCVARRCLPVHVLSAAMVDCPARSRSALAHVERDFIAELCLLEIARSRTV